MDMLNAFTKLEAMYAENRITSYEIQREPGKYTVTVAFLEFDADSPEGAPCGFYRSGSCLPLVMKKVEEDLPKREVV